MTKRASGKYERHARDFYATPETPILKLIPHLAGNSFAEPMCGDGAIVRVLESKGYEARFLADLEPQGEMTGRARKMDVLDTTANDYVNCSAIISNPPWPRRGGKGDPTVSIIKHLVGVQFWPVWLLLSADFMHTKYFNEVAPHCHRAISVGRVSWMHNNQVGYDNAVWYQFSWIRRDPSEHCWFVPNLPLDKNGKGKW